MHKLTFFPLGNADCIRIELERGRQLLFDYAAMRDPDDSSDRRIDLPTKLVAAHQDPRISGLSAGGLRISRKLAVTVSRG